MLTPIIAAFVSTWATLLLLPRTRLGRTALDVPNERSLHTTTVPRIGGVGIALGLACGAATIDGLDPVLRWLALSYGLLFAVSLTDDLRPLPVRLRLSVHLLAAAAWAIVLEVPFPWFLPAMLSIVWAANLFNFMDGADGLAGGMAVFGFAALAAAAAQSNAMALAGLCAGVAAASAAFLIFNTHPASLFMGDSGSVPLGFLAAGIGLYGAQRDHWPLLLPVFAFFPFIFDATYTLISRVLRGRKPWEPHREHLYQRLVQGGLGHWKMALIAYACMFLCLLCALATLRLSLAAQFALLSAIAVLSLIAASRISRRHRIGPDSAGR